MRIKHILILLALLCFAAQGLLLFTDYFFIAPMLPLSILAGIILYRYPQGGLLLLTFIIPFEGIFAGNKLFTGAKLIATALILIGVVKILMQQIPLSRLKNPLSWPIFLLLCCFLISSLFSSYPGISVQALRKLVTAMAIFYLVIIFYHELNLIHLARAVVAGVASTAAIALAMGSTDDTQRAIGLMEDPNFFALLLICATPLVLYLILFDATKLHRVVWGGLFLIMLTAFEKTMSRSGLLILVATLFLLGVNYRHLLKKLSPSQLSLVFMSGLIAGLITITILPREYRERILSLASISSGVRSYEDRSLSRRSSYIIVGLKAFKEHPLLGTGPGIFPLKYAESGYASAYTIEADAAEMYRRAHNTYLETLSETGLPGLISLLALLAMGIGQYRKARRYALELSEPQQAHLITHYAVSLAGVAMFLLFLSALTNKYLWIYLAVGCGMTAQQKIHSTRNKADRTPLTRT